MMVRKKILITVLTYPLPSRSYDELVCTAGVLEDGSWIRIYPVPLSFLKGKRSDGTFNSFKYSWIELDLIKRTDDFRPESHSPVRYDFRDIKVLKSIDTKNNWRERKNFCLVNVYKNLSSLINNSKAPKNTSLATFKPSSILSFDIEADSPNWKDEWKEIRKQTDLFANNTSEPEKIIPKIPYKFYYKFLDDEGKESRMMIEDWEIGALYSKYSDSKEALQKVKEKYWDEFVISKDLYFFLGTTKEWHMRRSKNPFVIIGVFYPKTVRQMSLFS